MARSKLETALRRMTPAEREDFAADAGSTPEALRHVAAGRRGASAHMAVLLDRAAAARGIKLPRSSLNAGCKTCEYARECEKRRKT